MDQVLQALGLENLRPVNLSNLISVAAKSPGDPGSSAEIINGVAYIETACGVVRELLIEITPDQAPGSPSPTAPIPITARSHTTINHRADGRELETETVDFPDVIYGGTLDAINGVLTIDKIAVDLGSLNWATGSSAFNLRSRTVLPNVIVPDNAAGRVYGRCSCYPVLSYNDSTAADVSMTIVFSNSNYAGRVWVHDSNFSSASDFKTAMQGQMLVYKTSDPVVLSVRSVDIPIYPGLNTVWADQGPVLKLIY